MNLPDNRSTQIVQSSLRSISTILNESSLIKRAENLQQMMMRLSDLHAGVLARLQSSKKCDELISNELTILTLAMSTLTEESAVVTTQLELATHVSAALKIFSGPE